MNLLPSVSNPQPDVIKLLETINTQKEESRLFQFLNNLNEIFNTQRSNLLMITPLPTVETACATLEQDEAQRAVLSSYSPGNEVLAMYGRTQLERPIICNVCGVKGHSGDKCWQVIGFPRWHPRNAANNGGVKSNTGAKPRTYIANPKWTSQNKQNSVPRMAAAVAQSCELFKC